MTKLGRTISKIQCTLAIAAVLVATRPFAVMAQSPQAKESSGDSTPGNGSSLPEKPSPQGNNDSNSISPKNDRLFGVLPNYLTVENASEIPPLSARQKFGIVAKTSFDPVEFPYVAFLAAIGQAENSEPGFGQGAAGYGKRYGSSFADNTDENFWVGAILPALLHQDPRYYQLGKGGIFHRAFYSMSRIFVTRTDYGSTQFNISEIAGSAISSGISSTYHPAGDRTFANTMSVWWTQVGWDIVSNEAKEFWPDVRRKIKKVPPPQ